MTHSSQIEKRRNKKFIINNSEALKQYAITNKKKLGAGIIIINLLLIQDDILRAKDLNYQPLPSEEARQTSLKQPIAYVVIASFWFKIIRLKIKKKYNIDIKKDYDFANKFLLIFIKDSALESFSIYSVKLI